MSADIPHSAEVIVVGGGVVGCSIAYHLTKAGVSDVLLCERKQLTSGTTWHAAGLLGQLRENRNATELAKYTAELYRTLESETGQATGCKFNGSVSLATNAERMEELVRRADMAKVFGLDVDVLGPGGVKDLYPLIEVDDLVGGVFIPSDGQGDPVGITQALAKGARLGGAQISENTPVLELLLDGEQKQVVGVRTEQGVIHAKKVVLACGMWTRTLAASIGVNVPLHACEHFYIVTEPFEGVTPDLPVLRDFDNCAYYKEDAGKILLGAFEPVAKPWGMEGIREDFCFDELPYDVDHFAPILEAAIKRMPALEQAGVQTFFCGPESFTPDDRYQLGRTPECDNLFVAAGMNSIGILSAGGVGKVLAHWITQGHPPADYADVDVRRNLPFQGNARYLKDRVSETLGLLYAPHWPFYQYETSRGVRQSVLHSKLESLGACFGEAAGWERANWFAPDGVEPRYEYSWGKQNWFEYSAAEHQQVRKRVGIFDQSSFAKFRVQGVDALKVLNNICANNVDVPPGRLVYTQWLNERGGIEADLTVTRLSDNDFLVITGVATQVRDFDWLNQHTPEDSHCVATDVTSGYAVLGVMGPDSRALLQRLTPADLSNEAFPFATSREIELGFAKVRASRVTYVGELGWELYIPTEFAPQVFDLLMEAGKEWGVKPIGMHAMNSLRIEKGYRHWGHDISEEDTPVEAGLSFAVDLSKPKFIGRDAIVAQKASGVTSRLVQFLLQDSDAMLYHNEPIYRDEVIVGYICSGMFGHTLGAAVGLGYVSHTDGASRVTPSWIRGGDYFVEVAGKKVAATASLRPLYDPDGSRVRL